MNEGANTEPGFGGWTGGSYSMYRVALAVAGGGALFARWAGGVPDGLGSALALGVWIALGLVAVGYRDRWAALAVAGGGAALEVGGDLDFATAPWVIVGLFGLHALTPEAPYGSVAARGRVDPGGGWSMPAHVPPFAWLLAALLPWSWSSGPVLGTDPGAMTWVALFLLLFLMFQPRWVGRRGGLATERVFYDGACGLCHGAVRFLIAEDPGDGVLRFAPLGGPTFQAAIPETLHGRLPDSILLLTEQGELLDRSRAVLHALGRLGGLWRVLAFLGEGVPLVLRDHLYDFVAKRRHRWFATPDEACPLLPPRLVRRFEA